MTRKSPFQINIPSCNLLSYVFPDNIQPLDKPIWIDAEDTSNSLSPRKLLEWVKRLGAGLDKLGLQRGDVAMMFTRNHIFVPVLYLGIAGSGRVFTGANPTYGVREAAYQIEDTQAKLLLVEPPFLEIILKAAKRANFPRDRIFLFDDRACEEQDGIKNWHTILASGEEAAAWKWPRMTPEESEATVAAINYSSGTTGLPKGVMLSHRNIMANVEQSLFMRDIEQSYPRGYGPPQRWLGFLPLYHVFGQLWSITAAAINKTPVYYMRAFNFPRFLQHIQNHRITHFQTAPPVLVMLAKRQETKQYDLSSLVNILCGAAPLSKELQNDVSDALNITIDQTWGMSELSCSCMHTPGGRDDRSGSVGYLDPNCEIKLLNSKKEEVKAGEPGELFVRGPNRCLGYHRNEKATHDTIDKDGFLKTGDIAVRDDYGWFWIVDRKKELIKVKGFQVAPAELEALLLENPDVADAAVVGLKLDHEELPRAYVVLKEYAVGKVRQSDIQEWIAQHAAKHKQLTGGVNFVDEIPKSPSGKIQRVIMRQWATRDIQERMSQRAKL